MSDPAVYFIANFAIEDAATYRNYEKGFFPMLKKHGGEFVTFDDAAHVLEGGGFMEGRVVIFKFPSTSAAEAWYADPEYQELSEHRRAGTKINFLVRVSAL